GRDGSQGRLQLRNVAPFRRNRGFNHCGPRRRYQLRTDQDRFARPFGPHREIQPASAHRTGIGGAGAVWGEGGRERALLPLISDMIWGPKVCNLSTLCYVSAALTAPAAQIHHGDSSANSCVSDCAWPLCGGGAVHWLFRRQRLYG